MGETAKDARSLKAPKGVFRFHWVERGRGGFIRPYGGIKREAVLSRGGEGGGGRTLHGGPAVE